MEFTTLTRTLNDCIGVFNGAYTRLAPYGFALLALLLLIDIALTGSWTALGMYGVGDLIKHFFVLAAWTYVTMNFQVLAKTVIESLVQAGLTGGGMSGADHSLLLDPSRIAGMGLEVTEPVLAALDNTSLFDKGGFGMMFIFGAGYLFMIACYFLMAIQIFIAVLEYYLVLACVGILVPFGAWAPTRFISEKAIGAVIASGIKLMVLSLVLASTGPILAKTTKSVAESAAAAGGHLTVNGLLGSALAAFAVALLTWKAPSIASGLLAGSPSLSASDAGRAASTAAAGAGAAVGAGSAALAATRRGTEGGAHIAGAAVTGAKLGAATSSGGGVARALGGAAGAFRGAGSAIAQNASRRVQSALGAGGIKEAFDRGGQTVVKKGSKPENGPLRGEVPRSTGTATNAPTDWWVGKAGGYQADPNLQKQADRRKQRAIDTPIRIGTDAGPDAGEAPPRLAADRPDDGGPPTATPPPPPAPNSGGDPDPESGAPAQIAVSGGGESISPPAWAKDAEQLIAASQKTLRIGPPPTA